MAETTQQPDRLAGLDVLLTKKDVAKAFGVCEKTVDNLVKRGKLLPGQETGMFAGPRWSRSYISGLLEGVAKKQRQERVA